MQLYGCVRAWLCILEFWGWHKLNTDGYVGKKKGRAEEALNQLIEVEGWKQSRDDNGTWTGFLSASGKGIVIGIVNK